MKSGFIFYGEANDSVYGMSGYVKCGHLQESEHQEIRGCLYIMFGDYNRESISFYLGMSCTTTEQTSPWSLHGSVNANANYGDGVFMPLEG